MDGMDMNSSGMDGMNTASEMDDMGMPAPTYRPGRGPDYYQNLPWYTRSGKGRTGNFLGHFVPAVFFFFFPIGILTLQLVRARRGLPSNRSFAEVYIPETDPIVLTRVAYLVLSATIVGITIETISGIVDAGDPFKLLAHQTLYFGYTVTAIFGLLEVKGRLPWDTHRAAMAIAMIGSFLMWYSHGSMKKLAVDQSIHIYLAYINLINALVVMYSIKYTNSLMAYITSYLLMILQALWLFLAGVYESGAVDLSMHKISAIMALMSMLVALAAGLVFAYFGPSQKENNNLQSQREFSPLSQIDGYDDKNDNI